MNIEPALLTPVALLLGALVGGSASLFGAIYTRRSQDRVQRIASEIAKRETVYADFVMSASSLLLNAYTRDEISLSGDEQRLIGLINRMRLFAPPDVVEGAEAALRAIVEISAEAEYRAPAARETGVVQEHRRSAAGIQLDLPGRLGQPAPNGGLRAQKSLYATTRCRPDTA